MMLRSKIILFPLLALFCLSPRLWAQTVSDDIVSESEMEKWLNAFSVDSVEVIQKKISEPPHKGTMRDSVAIDSISSRSVSGKLVVDSVKKEAAIADSMKEDSLSNSAKKAIPITKSYVRTRPKSYLDNIRKYSADELIAGIDSIAIRRAAIRESDFNPIFLDMVFEYPDTVHFFSGDSVISELHAEVRENLRQTQPELFVYHKDNIPSFKEIGVGYISAPSPEELMIKVNSMERDNNINIDMPKASFWTHGAHFQLHASQNYISDNWYKGGESNLNGIAAVNAFINYNDKNRIEWSNKMEWKLGVNGMAADTMRFFRVNEDIFKLTTKLGVKAFNNFYYTTEGEFSTQFFNTFVTNSNERITAPFSPIRLYLSLGLDYKYKGKLSVFASPVSYKYVYVADTTVAEGVNPANSIARKVGINAGDKEMHQFGGLVRVSFAHNFSREIGIETKFSFFANYVGDVKGVELDWEIICNFLINRFLSAKISLHPRYDTTIKTTDGSKPKIQFNEMISVGFNYRL